MKELKLQELKAKTAAELINKYGTLEKLLEKN